MSAAATAAPTGGEVLVSVLEALGADVVFGLPGIHALPVWNALDASPIRVVPLRTELDAGFAADGYARVSGKPAPVLLSTGPGALNALTALMEGASAHVPMIAIATQIPRAFLGRGRGQLHELPDQLASFAPLVKAALHVGSRDELPLALEHAWALAQRAPSGPVFLEIPTDVLSERSAWDGTTSPPDEAPVAAADPVALEEAAALLRTSATPVLWAGGGVIRGAAWDELRALAEHLDAPVVTTFMGRGAIADDHPLAAGSACNEQATQDLLAAADVVLCVGSQLGADTTREYSLAFAGRLVHVDADPERIGATYPALALLGDAAPTLRAILDRLPPERLDRDGRRRAAAVRSAIGVRMATEEHGPELGMVQAIRDALPTDAVDAWDSTILGYWGASYFEARLPRRFLYPLGSGTIGYALPAALGAAAALPGVPVLAVVGDGGFQYGIAELAAAKQAGLAVKLLLVDDGGYGILREYQLERYGKLVATDMEQPDFVALCASFGVPTRATSAATLREDVAWAVAQPGPVALVLRAGLSCYRMS